MSSVNQAIAALFAEGQPVPSVHEAAPEPAQTATLSYVFFSDVRKDISDQQKYAFVRELVEFADQNGFEAVYFPERHFAEFGSIFANNALMAAYFAPLTRNIRLRSAAVTNTLHHPAAIVEDWAMVDVLSGGRVDLGFGSGWNKADFILSPDTWEDRSRLRNERIPVIQTLWRGGQVAFKGPHGETFETRVYPRPLQPELNIWYTTTSEAGFKYAGAHGYNVFTMLMNGDLDSLQRQITLYRQARSDAGLVPQDGIVSLLQHAFVHPDLDWVHQVVRAPLLDYIRSNVSSQVRAGHLALDRDGIDKTAEYAYTRYFQQAGVFGSPAQARAQIDRVIRAGVNDVVLLQDFGVDYAAVRETFPHLIPLVNHCHTAAPRSTTLV
ncbi:MupA/Atu3671 family FMN-dependent luciferase-like monooxygenase [Gynuella sunshinyii]|uniref:Flavin-dependent oxidoreductase n=1 Tax=Gynuella sunshinyii YC6258 TaxID=1445510 RepID=A0A0C5V6N0_9GAMM|nr:MupA/Atu3671 family FMN-dependent luciferase-like monooxygenase [Gynuella sunshinyii]AJQ95100.1 coenzyme F420-dependent N5,N10-methylene tetrahydromethanopterin reductase and related flavin-dependent oxidoreductase [Gynuella sunshinyii YC6258]DAC80075.1 TPA_exp: flavin-dependent oxidoreductase [Gynuella sunshinyii YC6258]